MRSVHVGEGRDNLAERTRAGLPQPPGIGQWIHVRCKKPRRSGALSSNVAGHCLRRWVARRSSVRPPPGPTGRRQRCDPDRRILRPALPYLTASLWATLARPDGGDTTAQSLGTSEEGWWNGRDRKRRRLGVTQPARAATDLGVRREIAINDGREICCDRLWSYPLSLPLVNFKSQYRGQVPGGVASACKSIRFQVRRLTSTYESGWRGRRTPGCGPRLRGLDGWAQDRTGKRLGFGSLARIALVGKLVGWKQARRKNTQ